jgi:adenine specific DNA methylase Mod
MGGFDGPKPVRLMKHLITLARTSPDDIILDFFSGSATTAHAVMQQNAEDGGNRWIIFADQCFRDSTDKSNVKLTLRDRGITIRVL